MSFPQNRILLSTTASLRSRPRESVRQIHHSPIQYFFLILSYGKKNRISGSAEVLRNLFGVGRALHGTIVCRDLLGPSRLEFHLLLPHAAFHVPEWILLPVIVEETFQDSGAQQVASARRAFADRICASMHHNACRRCHRCLGPL